jgi:uncharacterized damage-inducible protein DinB
MRAATPEGLLNVRYDFLVATYETERLKVLSVWSAFREEDLPFRPHPEDKRGRSVLEQMVHQCVSEDFWFRSFLGIDVGAPPLPAEERRMAFLRRYAADSKNRLRELRARQEPWWEEEVGFFEVRRSRAWIVVRRVAHTSHHRGQQTAMLRMLGRDLHSNYGPTADTGGLMQSQGKVLYAYPDAETLLKEEERGGRKAQLPGPGAKPPTERP